MSFYPRPNASSLSAIVAVLALAGCGSTSTSSTSQAATASQSASTSAARSTGSSTATTAEHVPTIDITVTSPESLKPISKVHTCDGANVPPTILLSKIPPNAAELELFVVHYDQKTHKIMADWGVAGLKPTLRRITAGRLPSGAVIGRNDHGQMGYSVCPSHGENVEYVIAVLAPDHKVSIKPGFDARALRAMVVKTVNSEGLLDFTYKRR